jgi:bacterioferritin-associated ferredoxin
MYVCHCRAVTDRVIRAQIEQGARDEESLVRACGAGGRCGGCLPLMRRLLLELDRTVGFDRRPGIPAT